jgi:hypothetical protein
LDAVDDFELRVRGSRGFPFCRILFHDTWKVHPRHFGFMLRLREGCIVLFAAELSDGHVSEFAIEALMALLRKCVETHLQQHALLGWLKELIGVTSEDGRVQWRIGGCGDSEFGHPQSNNRKYEPNAIYNTASVTQPSINNHRNSDKSNEPQTNIRYLFSFGELLNGSMVQ